MWLKEAFKLKLLKTQATFVSQVSLSSPVILSIESQHLDDVFIDMIIKFYILQDLFNFNHKNVIMFPQISMFCAIMISIIRSLFPQGGHLGNACLRAPPTQLRHWCILLQSIVFECFLLYSNVLYCILLFSFVFFCFLLQSIIFYCIVFNQL